MDIDRRKKALSQLGLLLFKIGDQRSLDVLFSHGLNANSFQTCLDKTMAANAWFTEDSLYGMLTAIGKSLHENELSEWIELYDFHEVKDPKCIGVVMAGNIPAVGFHDFLSVIMSGHKILARLSSDDQYLIPGIADLLCEIDNGFSEQIEFTHEKMKGFDAVIATGSNNTARYFEYYFGKYPNIIRKNRNGLAILNGKESKEELHALGNDIFMYFGLGCRNISKMMVPADYDFTSFFESIESYSPIGNHSKYRNNYDYNKSIFLVNGDPHLDNGFLLLKENQATASPMAVLYYEQYQSLDEINNIICAEAENIQCVVSIDERINNRIPPGESQHPRLWDYADGVDTMKFLLAL